MPDPASSRRALTPKPGVRPPSTRVPAVGKAQTEVVKPSSAVKPPSSARLPAVAPKTPASGKPQVPSVKTPASGKPAVASNRLPAVKPAAKPASRSARPPVMGPEDRESRRADAMAKEKRRKIIILCIVGIVAAVGLTLLIGVGPYMRSSQLAAIDACRDGRADEGRRLAKEFAEKWSPGSEYVRRAVRDGRGPFEARIEWCKAGNHLDLMATYLIPDNAATPAQRAEVLSELASRWPETGHEAPRLPPSVSDWVSMPETDLEVAKASARVLLAAAPADADMILARAAADPKLSDERAASAVEALAGLVERKSGEGMGRLLDTVTGPHRAAVLACEAVAKTVGDNATPGYGGRLLKMLGDADTQPLALAGLSGSRFELGPEPGPRADFAANVKPFLSADAGDAVLAGALKVCKRQRLTEARKDLLALLPRLATKLPAGLERGDVAELFGRDIITTSTPANTAAAEEVIVGLTAALADTGTRPLAAACLAQVKAGEVLALRKSLDVLAKFPKEQGCRDALAVIVGKVYGREDIVAAAAKGWAEVLAEDGKRRARYDGMCAWMDAHKDDTTARAEKSKLAEARLELSAYREEVTVWLSSKDPPPLGLTQARFQELSQRVNMMHKLVNAAFSAQ